jgi:uncharacterized membrane protein
MKRGFQILSSLLVTGLLVVIPAWLSLLLLMKLLTQLSSLLRPIAKLLPPGINHPDLVGALGFVLICLVTGLLLRTAVGRALGHACEPIFLRVPGYQSLRSIARQLVDPRAHADFKPALIEIEDGCLAPAFLVQTHEQDRATVFMPSAPTPLTGSIFIMARERVHPIDVPVPVMLKWISNWGMSSREIENALGRIPPPGAPARVV